MISRIAFFKKILSVVTSRIISLESWLTVIYIYRGKGGQNHSKRGMANPIRQKWLEQRENQNGRWFHYILPSLPDSFSRFRSARLTCTGVVILGWLFYNISILNSKQVCYKFPKSQITTGRVESLKLLYYGNSEPDDIHWLESTMTLPEPSWTLHVCMPNKKVTLPWF